MKKELELKDGLYTRGDKIYLDKDEKIESRINDYLKSRDGVVEMYQYYEENHLYTRLFWCQDPKYDMCAIIRHTIFESGIKEEHFPVSDWCLPLLTALMNGNKEQFGGNYRLIREDFPD